MIQYDFYNGAQAAILGLRQVPADISAERVQGQRGWGWVSWFVDDDDGDGDDEATLWLFAGTSCGASSSSAPLWTSSRTATPGPCWSTCCSSAFTPSPPAAPTPSAPCPQSLATSATSLITEHSVSTVSVRLHTRSKVSLFALTWHFSVFPGWAWNGPGVGHP